MYPMTTRRATWTPAKLLRWRKAMGWSQEEAAAWYGVTEGAWRHWENGRRKIPRPLINALTIYRQEAA